MSNHSIYLTVRSVKRETEDTISITFQHPQKGLLQYKPGQYLTLISPGDSKSRRCYSLCTSPDADAFPAVAVKLILGGQMSTWLFDSLKEGDKLEVLEPMGNFVFEPKPDKRRHIMLFAAGSGVTPLMSILKSALKTEPKSIVSLIYGNRFEHGIIFREELDALQAQHPARLRIVHCLTSPPEKWYGATGRISEGMLGEILDQLQPFPPAEDTLHYMCGPRGMMDAVISVLAARKVPKDRIYHESFFSDAPAIDFSAIAEDEGIIAREVKVIYDDVESTFTVPPQNTILEAAQDLDIDLPYSCQSGLCTSCRGKCISGKVLMTETEGLSDSELKEGYVLTCVSHPLTDNVVIEIG
ncbi:MAG: ferredoxin--NADP reductase [Bacteroidota bacterium]